MGFRQLFISFLAGLLLVGCASNENSDLGSLDPVRDKIADYLLLESQAGFSGIVAVHQAGKEDLFLSYGYRNKEKSTPVNSATVFDIGSITKQFTAAAILKLCESGKLNLADSLGQLFRDFPADKGPITIHQLLTHTAGFPKRLGSDLETLSKAAFIGRVKEVNLEFTPGTDFNYSHIGYSLLGIIIEKLGRTSYESYLNENLFVPAGMNQTGYTLPRWNLDQVANGYYNCHNYGKPLDMPWDAQGPFWNLKANGGLMSTAKDLMNWYQALRENKVLNRTSTALLTARHVQEGNSESHYGYGWSILESRRNSWAFRHEGGNGVFYSDWVNYPNEDVSILLLSNEGRRGNWDMVFELAKIIFYPDHEPVVQGLLTECLDSLPNNILGQLAGAFLDMMTSDDHMRIDKLMEENIGAYMRKKHSKERIRSVLQDIQADAGPLRILQVRVTDHRIVNLDLVRVADNEKMVLRLSFDPDDDYKLKSIFFNTPGR